jgi:hypothetical protein
MFWNLKFNNLLIFHLADYLYKCRKSSEEKNYCNFEVLNSWRNGYNRHFNQNSKNCSLDKS